ncbi:unnamed protein product [Blepharisma stoltei]|uniref:Uncharacterized protein n=1 Tax=Blepharisma stoltei TaxID=1481888 RepID=A0AAU9JNR0_9CILI|nr:unnamed protein product [Blepharisma stoltei]
MCVPYQYYPSLHLRSDYSAPRWVSWKKVSPSCLFKQSEKRIRKTSLPPLVKQENSLLASYSREEAETFSYDPFYDLTIDRRKSKSKPKPENILINVESISDDDLFSDMNPKRKGRSLGKKTILLSKKAKLLLRTKIESNKQYQIKTPEPIFHDFRKSPSPESALVKSTLSIPDSTIEKVNQKQVYKEAFYRKEQTRIKFTGNSSRVTTLRSKNEEKIMKFNKIALGINVKEENGLKDASENTEGKLVISLPKIEKYD